MALLESTRKLTIRRIEISGPGVLILTGPSGCGKGEVASALCDFLAIPRERWLSMGNILRDTFSRAANDEVFRSFLDKKYDISDSIPLAATPDATKELLEKIERHADAVSLMVETKRRIAHSAFDWRDTTALEWLQYCTMYGLLVPNRWTQDLIAAHIESEPSLKENTFILDGYPRTVAAAEHLLNELEVMRIPVLRVLHLSISKHEMLRRAELRQRADDNLEALLKRYAFYIENVQPSVDYMKDKLGASIVSLVDAHQPFYVEKNGQMVLDVPCSIRNVVQNVLTCLGLAALDFSPSVSIDN